MGIKTNLQAFIDPEYSDYQPPPIDAEAPLEQREMDLKEYTANKWVEALADPITELLAPCAAGGLIAANVKSDLSSQINASSMESGFPTVLDNALKFVADKIVIESAATSAPTAPAAPLSSKEKIFSPESNFPPPPPKSPEQVCESAETEIIAWFQTGQFNAFMNPTFPGIPSPWGIPVPESAIEDSDLDGIQDHKDAFPEDPDETVDTDGDGIGDNADSDPQDPLVQ